MTQHTRSVRVIPRDTLRRLAFRELGDAGRADELAGLNRLRYPYIIQSDDEANRQPGTLIWGDWIRVPVGSPQYVPQTEPEIFGCDLALTGGVLSILDGDLVCLSGIPNFSQALSLRLSTPLGEATCHPRYGSVLSALVGSKNLPVAQLLAVGFASECVKQDPRVGKVGRVSSQASGDTLRVSMRVVGTETNEFADLNFVYPPPWTPP